MASNVEFSVGNKHLRRVAIVAFLGVIGGATASSCADSDTVTTAGTTGSSSGVGGEGNAAGAGGMGGGDMSSSSGKSSSSSSGSMGGGGGAGGSGGTGGTMCTPTTEVCDGADNDCNGMVDDNIPGGCACVAGQSQNCYTGDPMTEGKGICKGGTQMCVDGQWGACMGEVLPKPETCEGTDEDCDGMPDNGCSCTAGQTQTCYTGPMGTENTGTCKPGMQTCDPTGMYGACVGSITPQPETCNGLDDDCDGVIDNGNPGGGAMCTATGLGECKKGTLNCINGAVKCSPGQVMPETCDGLDNNCDGNTDEGNPGGGMQCMTGLMGLCATGLTQCQGVNGIMCVANVVPGQLMEACNNIDDDCDGLIDDGIAQVGQPCTDPTQMGVCRNGIFECNAGSMQLSCKTPMPTPETCNAKDDDCNGTIDDSGQVNNQPCNTGLPGICSMGTSFCSGGSSTCNATITPGSRMETCNGQDDNCNGVVDDPAQVNGASCNMNLPQGCTTGSILCTGGVPTCTPTPNNDPEKCDGLDNNCNGMSDEGITNPTATCAGQYPTAGGVTTWGCTMGTCQIQQCAIGTSDVDGAQFNGCECMTDQNANSCVAAGNLSVPVNGTVNMVGKVETAMGSDWMTFSFIAPSMLGVTYKPRIQLINNAGGEYAMDVMRDCSSLTTCNDGGSGANANIWELSYAYNQMGNPSGPWMDNDAKITSVKVRVYRRNGTPPTCNQYTVTATNPSM